MADRAIGGAVHGTDRHRSGTALDGTVVDGRHRVKVGKARLAGRALTRTGLAAAIVAASMIIAPAPAAAITRAEIIARSKKWVAKRVPYSQHRYHRGYRQDCSGFVSMAWRLKRSYTSRTLHTRAKRVPIAKLKPGDAVWKPGHVSIFGGWKNKKKRQYYALEQTQWGSHAKRRVRTIPRNAKGLRYTGVKERRRVTVASAPRVSAPKVVALQPTAGAVASVAIREASETMLAETTSLSILAPAAEQTTD